MGWSKKYGYCVGIEDTAKQKIETPKGDPNASGQVVTYVNQRYKCSKYPRYVTEEELPDNEEEKKVITGTDSAEEVEPEDSIVEIENSEEEKEDKEMTQIKENFRRFL